MTTRTIRVFVNGAAVDLPAGAAALDAVRARDAALAGDVSGGRSLITDSRGLPIDAAAPMSAGSILRVIPRRDRAGVDDADA